MKILTTLSGLKLSTMAYTPIPSESKKQINRAGDLLCEYDDKSLDIYEKLDTYFRSLDLANQWRACHAYPINTFQATLRTNLLSYKGTPIVAQRLKRMPTVIDKLKRHQHMKLTTMQDIGGVRGIVDDMTDLNKIVSKYVNNKSFPHQLIEKYDYVNNPRDQDGYRSIHLVYKYSNLKKAEYDGLRVEMQLRTKLQHIWATAVETVGVFLKQSLKTRQGDEEWLNFFALVSSAFALTEETPPLKRFAHLDYNQTCAEIASTEKRLGILAQLHNFTYIVETVGDQKAHSYHLIVNDNTSKKVYITSFDRTSQQKALSEFAEKEKVVNEKNENVDITLVSAGKIDTLRKAYPNLFLDLSEFISQLNLIITYAKMQPIAISPKGEKYNL
jgi:hypothetical protein